MPMTRSYRSNSLSWMSRALRRVLRSTVMTWRLLVGCVSHRLVVRVVPERLPNEVLAVGKILSVLSDPGLGGAVLAAEDRRSVPNTGSDAYVEIASLDALDFLVE